MFENMLAYIRDNRNCTKCFIAFVIAIIALSSEKLPFKTVQASFSTQANIFLIQFSRFTSSHPEHNKYHETFRIYPAGDTTDTRKVRCKD